MKRSSHIQRIRWTAVLFGVVCVVGQALDLVHVATVQHTTCMAHGETIHAAEVGGRETGAYGQLPNADNNATGGATLQSADEAAAHEHGHCACITANRSLGFSAGVQISARVHQHSESAAIPATDVLLGLTATYRLAPKTSPPNFS